MKRILIYLLTPLLLVLAVACEDRLDVPGGDIPEGISTFDVEVGFKNFTPALGSRAAGNAIKEIETLWVVIYDKEGGYIDRLPITDFTFKSLENNTRPDGKPSSETQTGCAKFKLTLPNGWYKIYAVANYDLSKYTDEQLDTEDKLCSLSFEWDSSDVTKNAQMFGCFVEGDKMEDKSSHLQHIEGDPEEREDGASGTLPEVQQVRAPEVAVRGNDTKLHAWLRRAVSKVTIAFDTQKLNENIFIYIKSVAIKDIPASCSLGKTNTPAVAADTLPGEIIYLANADASQTDAKKDHNRWREIATGDTLTGLYSDVNGSAKAMSYEDRYKREHQEAARALYFYENMQGQGTPNSESDKRQDVIDDGKPEVTYPGGNSPTHDAWKDAKKFGTYIEIDGYYVNHNITRPSQGKIRYRFMLGKNTTTDYNAERNHHYMLTMKFNGNANDVDFHIDYREEESPGSQTPDTVYVSYLYDQSCYAGIRATPKPGYDLADVTAVIIDNEWRPHDAVGGVHYNGTAWNMQIDGDGGYEGGADANKRLDPECKPNCEFGFLSLRETTLPTVDFDGNSYDASQKKKMVCRMRNFYFAGDASKGNNKINETTLLEVKNPKGKRVYDKKPTTDGSMTVPDSDNGDYIVTRTTNKNNGVVDYVLQIPLYTRAKSLDSWATYSGSNAFYEHHRFARIKFIFKYVSKTNEKDTYSEVRYTTVLQARRIDNPAGIYRKYNSTESFRVLMTYSLLTPNGDNEFEPVVSRGPWSATIESDPNKIVKLIAGTQVVTGQGNKITGSTNTQIDFTFTPNNNDVKSTEAFGAVITVRYHNNSCVHKILVRQGYAACKIGTTGNHKWSAFCVYDAENLTKSPLSMGSLFVRHTDLSYPILESNDSQYGVGKRVPSGYEFLIGNNKPTTKWLDIPFSDVDATFGEFTLKNTIKNTNYTYRIPDQSEIWEIGIFPKNASSEVQELANKRDFVFGMFYADGAKGTLLTKDAYSYSDPDNEGLENEKGVYGVGIYSRVDGSNVFFPFGPLGHPRRKNRQLLGDDSGQDNGVLRYGSVDGRLERTADHYRPMAWDLPSQKGASFWTIANGDQSIAIDFNAGNFMTNFLNKDDLYTNNRTGYENHSDALQIRPIISEQ